jgi:2-methylcitrate dehydratase PrpD
MTLARRSVRAWRDLDSARIPADVLGVAKLHLLDALGVGLAASTGRAGSTYHSALDRLGSQGQATVIGRSRPAAPADAALANGGLIHALEYDDTHTGSIVHGSSVLAAAALAAGEAAGASGRATLAAYVKGWEWLVRVGLAAPGEFQREGFQITVTAGVMAAALIAADLAGATEDETVDALGIALSQCSGVFEFLVNGSTVKSFHPGWAAHGGLVAAALAQSGLTGPQTSLDGQRGLFARFAGRREAGGALALLMDDFGSRWHLADAAFKFHPCCHYIHPYLTALDDLLARGVAPDEIVSLTCFVAAGAAPIICDPWQRRLEPSTPHEMRYSLPIVIAMRLVEGGTGLDAFERPASEAVKAWARRIDWLPLEPNRFPDRFEAVLKAQLRDGRTVLAEVDDVFGGARHPATDSEVMVKFRANASRRGSASAAETLAGVVFSLEERSVGDLGAALRAVAAE